MELFNHRGDHCAKKRGDGYDHHEKYDEDGKPSGHAPAGEHADDGVETDCEEQGDQCPDQHVACEVDRACGGRRHEDTEAGVEALVEQNHPPHAAGLLVGRGVRRNTITHECSRQE